MKRRLVTVGHSYVVTLNRRLANELAREGRDKWDVTAIAPSFFHGDLRDLRLDHPPDEPHPVVGVRTLLSRRAHAFFYGAKLRSVLHRGWDLVHAWEEPYIVSGWQIAQWTPKRTPFVFATFQNNSKRYPPPFAQMERQVVRRSAGWIAYGDTVAEALRTRDGYATKPTEIIPPGVDTVHFAPDAEAGRRVAESLGWERQGAPIVGYLGRFVPAKGLALLMRTLDASRAPWRALFVGTGPLEQELRTWGQRHGDRVRVCTGVRHDDVPAYLNAMDLLCAPSQTTSSWREQFGRMLTEAFACGVPVIASDSGEIPYTVGDAGKIVGENDEAAWLRTVQDVLESPDLRRDMSAQGRDRALNTFAWPRIARRHLAFFEKLIG